MIEALSPLDNAYCTDPRCACANHRLLDTSLLAVYGIDVRAFTQIDGLILACLLPPGKLVWWPVLLRSVWGPGALETETASRHAARIHMLHIRDKLPRYGWDLITYIGVGLEMVPASEERIAAVRGKRVKLRRVPLHQQLAPRVAELTASGLGTLAISMRLGVSIDTVKMARKWWREQGAS